MSADDTFSSASSCLSNCDPNDMSQEDTDKQRVFSPKDFVVGQVILPHKQSMIYEHVYERECC